MWKGVIWRFGKIPCIPPHGCFLQEMPGDVCLGLPCRVVSFDLKSMSPKSCRNKRLAPEIARLENLRNSTFSGWAFFLLEHCGSLSFSMCFKCHRQQQQIACMANGRTSLVCISVSLVCCHFSVCLLSVCEICVQFVLTRPEREPLLDLVQASWLKFPTMH